MSEPSQFTAQQASDPATPAEVLAAIAEHRPDLRPMVAANPTTYPGLLEWLGRLGDPAVDAAIASRAAAVAPEPPTAPIAPEAGGPAPEQGFAAPGYQPPGATAYGAPDYQPPAGPGDPAGPSAPYGAPYGGPPPKKSKAWLWILLGVLGLLVIGGVVVGIIAVNKAREVIDQIDLPTSIGSDANSYGDDPALDALWDSCEAGDMAACDDLFRESPVGSEYEDFGDTCGNRTDGSTYCVDADVDGATSGTDETSPADDGQNTSGEPFAYGDDPALDALWDSCEAGDMASCDQLYRESPVDSEYESFGDTCGNRQEGGDWCEQ
jgi:hypothetical protein